MDEVSSENDEQQETLGEQETDRATTTRIAAPLNNNEAVNA
jgi:hypothetical protein